MTIHPHLPNNLSRIVSVASKTTHSDIHDALHQQARKLGADYITLSKLGSLKTGKHKIRTTLHPAAPISHRQYIENEYLALDTSATTLKKLKILYRSSKVLKSKSGAVSTQFSVIKETLINHDKLEMLGRRNGFNDKLTNKIIDCMDEHTFLLMRLANRSDHPEIRTAASQAFDYLQSLDKSDSESEEH